MFIRNNPNIDFDTLESEVEARVAAYRENRQEDTLPEYDPQRLQRASLNNVYGDLHQLYALEDMDFVHYAYQFLLCRPPTEYEAAVCVSRLRAGENKTRIACELRYCDEGKNINRSVSLRKEYIAYKLIALPIIGKLVNLLSILVSLPALKTLSQAKENHHYRVMQLLENENSQKRLRIGELDKKLREHEQQLEQLQTELGTVRGEMEEAQKAIATSRTRLSLLERQQSSLTPGKAANTTPPAACDSHSDDALYVAFEDQYRGSASNIRDRQSAYLPLIEKTLRGGEAPASGKIIDVGCGRGEWLALLKEHGFEATGIDTNVHNIKCCHEANLTALHEDALQWLARQADASLGCISAFHVIEHLEFNRLSHFLDSALRCLCPGGLLLLETPNPENLLVGSNAFYLDPTHIRPLPPGLMEFLLTYKGFRQVMVERKHPVAASLMIHEDTEVARRCNQLFYEAQDYSISGIRP